MLAAGTARVAEEGRQIEAGATPHINRGVEEPPRMTTALALDWRGQFFSTDVCSDLLAKIEAAKIF